MFQLVIISTLGIALVAMMAWAIWLSDTVVLISRAIGLPSNAGRDDILAQIKHLRAILRARRERLGQKDEA